MPRTFNTTIGNDANRIFNFKGGDQLSSEIVPNIQPTVEIKRICNVVRGVNSTASGTTTVFTTPADKDFYLSNASVGVATDAASDNISTQLAVVIEGTTRVLIDIPKITLTAFTGYVNENYAIPLKLDRNTTITLPKTFTVGTGRFTSTIIGYTSEMLSSANLL